MSAEQSQTLSNESKTCDELKETNRPLNYNPAFNAFLWGRHVYRGSYCKGYMSSDFTEHQQSLGTHTKVTETYKDKILYADTDSVVIQMDDEDSLDVLSSLIIQKTCEEETKESIESKNDESFGNQENGNDTHERLVDVAGKRNKTMYCARTVLTPTESIICDD